MVVLDKLNRLQNLREQRSLLQDQNQIAKIKKEKEIKRVDDHAKNILFSNKKAKGKSFFLG